MPSRASTTHRSSHPSLRPMAQTRPTSCHGSYGRSAATAARSPRARPMRPIPKRPSPPCAPRPRAWATPTSCRHLTGRTHCPATRGRNTWTARTKGSSRSPSSPRTKPGSLHRSGRSRGTNPPHQALQHFLERGIGTRSFDLRTRPKHDDARPDRATRPSSRNSTGAPRPSRSPRSQEKTGRSRSRPGSRAGCCGTSPRTASSRTYGSHPRKPRTGRPTTRSAASSAPSGSDVSACAKTTTDSPQPTACTSRTSSTGTSSPWARDSPSSPSTPPPTWARPRSQGSQSSQVRKRPETGAHSPCCSGPCTPWTHERRGFRTHFYPAEREGHSWVFYSGEALLFLAESTRIGLPDAPDLPELLVLYRRCRDLWREDRHVAMVSWHSQAATSLYRLANHGGSSSTSCSNSTTGSSNSKSPRRTSRTASANSEIRSGPSTARRTPRRPASTSRASPTRATSPRPSATTLGGNATRPRSPWGYAPCASSSSATGVAPGTSTTPKRCSEHFRSNVHDNRLRIDNCGHALTALAKLLAPADLREPATRDEPTPSTGGDSP